MLLYCSAVQYGEKERRDWNCNILLSELLYLTVGEAILWLTLSCQGITVLHSLPFILYTRTWIYQKVLPPLCFQPSCTLTKYSKCMHNKYFTQTKSIQQYAVHIIVYHLIQSAMTITSAFFVACWWKKKLIKSFTSIIHRTNKGLMKLNGDMFVNWGLSIPLKCSKNKLSLC